MFEVIIDLISNAYIRQDIYPSSFTNIRVLVLSIFFVPNHSSEYFIKFSSAQFMAMALRIE